MRYFFIILILISSLKVSAYSNQNLVDFYEDFYEEELGIGFLVKRYNIRDPKLRYKILSFMKSKDWEVDSSEIGEEWTSFINKNYPDPTILQKVLENNYHSISNAKTKFIDDLDLKRYFRIVVIPRLEKDFKLRERLIKGVVTAKMSELERFEAQRQFLAILKLRSIEQLEHKYPLTSEDLDFLLTSNFLLEKKSFRIYNLDLQKRIYNLKANSNMTTQDAKKYIFRNYKNRAQYLY